MTRQSFIERLLAKLDVGLCWEWTGYVMPNGYARITREGQATYLHRAVWEELVGPIPEGFDIDHLCRNRRCCNTDHLEPVPHRVNVLRGRAHGPYAWGPATTCRHGHDLSGQGTWTSKDGKVRRCRTCLYLRHAESKARREGA